MEQHPIIKRHPLTIDEALIYLGGYRQFQWIVDAIFCFMAMPRVFQVLLMYFAALDPPWKCVENSTVCLLNGTLPSSNRARCGMSRSDWEYTQPKDLSIASQFNLQCENEWQMHLLTSIVFLGWGLGAIVLGWIADNYGRKCVIYPSQAIIIIVGFICSFFKNIHLIVLCRFVIGFFIPGATVQSFVLASEYVAPQHRPFAGLIIFVSFSASMCVLALKAYLIRNWKYLSIVCTIPYIISLVTYSFIPESVRWLRLKRGRSELMETFRRIAYWNERELPNDLAIVPPSQDVINHKSTLMDIFKSRRIALISLISGYAWIVNGMVYYGLVLAAGDLGGSVYINFFLLSFVGIPANFMAIYLCQRVGRKKTVIISMLIASLFCIIVAFIPAENEGKIARITFGMIGKFCIGLSFGAIYVWSLEIYPTTIRANGMGFLQVASRVGAASAPWIAKGLLSLNRAAPFIVMGASALIATILLVFLPETRDRPTLETNEDMHADTTKLIYKANR